MRKLLLLIVSIIPLISTFGQENGKVVAGSYNGYEVSYLLPKTVVDIEIVAEQTVEKKGLYANYSQKYLGIPASVTSDNEYWNIVSVKASLRGVPDLASYYTVQLKSGASPFVYLDKEGLLLSVNTESTAADVTAQSKDVVAKKTEKPKSSPLEDNSYALSLTEEMLQSGSNVKMAELAAKQIYGLRESRIELITGDTDQKYDGEALKIMLANIDEQESRLLSMFSGTKTTRRTTYNIVWEPKGVCENEVVARLSEKEGIVDKDNLSGSPLYASIVNAVEGEEPLDSKGNPVPFPKNAVTYNIPGSADIVFSYKGRNIFSDRMNFTQLGVKFGLNSSLFTDKKQPTYMVLYPYTGAIKEVGQKIKE